MDEAQLREHVARLRDVQNAHKLKAAVSITEKATQRRVDTNKAKVEEKLNDLLSDL